MNQHEQIAKSRLGRLLVNRGYITEEQLSAALVIQARDGVMLGEVLIAQGLITEKDLARTLKQQKRHRYTAAFVALVATPFQPMMALAASPAGLPLTNHKIELSEVSLGGLKLMDDSELSGISAQGISPGMINMGLEKQATSLNADLQFRQRDLEDDEESHEEQIVAELADTALTLAGIGPISDFLDAKISIDGVKYKEGRAAIEILTDGSMKFYMPTEIARVSMEDIRIKGDDSGATLGNIYMSDISYHPDSNYTIRANN